MPVGEVVGADDRRRQRRGGGHFDWFFSGVELGFFGIGGEGELFVVGSGFPERSFRGRLFGLVDRVLDQAVGDRRRDDLVGGGEEERGGEGGEGEHVAECNGGRRDGGRSEGRGDGLDGVRSRRGCACGGESLASCE